MDDLERLGACLIYRCLRLHAERSLVSVDRFPFFSRGRTGCRGGRHRRRQRACSARPVGRHREAVRAEDLQALFTETAVGSAKYGRKGSVTHCLSHRCSSSQAPGARDPGSAWALRGNGRNGDRRRAATERPASRALLKTPAPVRAEPAHHSPR